MVRRHYQAVSIVFRNLTVKFDDLHEARAFVNFPDLPLKLAKYAGPVQKIVPLVDCHILRATLSILKGRYIVIVCAIDSRTLPTLSQVTDITLTARFIG